MNNRNFNSKVIYIIIFNKTADMRFSNSQQFPILTDFEM